MEQNRSCSGHGTCSALGEVDTVCICDAGYSGDECGDTCDGYCQGTFPYGCSSNFNDGHCNPSGGCSYNNAAPSGYCTYKANGSSSSCGCETDNDGCTVSGRCKLNGLCPDPVPLNEGAPCNDSPWGTCKSGVCRSDLTHAPTKGPMEPPRTKSPTRAPTPSPTSKPTPSSVSEENCDGFCEGEYPYNCATNVAGKTALRCHKEGGCFYAALPTDPSPYDGFCTFKVTGAPPTGPTPTKAPTRPPTPPPTSRPTTPPTKTPTRAPTLPPTSKPTTPPTKAPTKPPTLQPITPPTKKPTSKPTPSSVSEENCDSFCQ
eukprot:scaffold28430_cov58-Attheya_sp.AAC.3